MSSGWSLAHSQDDYDPSSFPDSSGSSNSGGWSDWQHNFDDESSTFTPPVEEKQRDAVIFLLDFTRPMHESALDDSTAPNSFQLAVQAVVTFAKQKIIQSGADDLIGVLLMGTTRLTTNNNSFPHLHKYLPLSHPTAAVIKQLQHLRDGTAVDEVGVGGVETIDMFNALWSTQAMFNEVNTANKTSASTLLRSIKRVFILTCNDQPYGDESERQRALVKCRDLSEQETTIELFRFNRRDHKFDPSLFWRAALVYDDSDRPEQLDVKLEGNWEELRSYMLRKVSKKRALGSIHWQLGHQVKLAVRLFVLYLEAKREAPVFVERKSNVRLTAETRYIDTSGGQYVEKYQMKKYFPYGCFTADDHELLTEAGFMSLKQVEEWFETYGTLRVGCMVGHALEFHHITSEEVTVCEGTHQLINFANKKHMSLSVTSNHKMWVSVDGATFGKQQAGELEAAGRAGTIDAVNFAARIPGGVVEESDADGSFRLFCDYLGLITPDQKNAFLELYGYWLVGGCLDGTKAYVVLRPMKKQDMPYLDKLLARIGLPSNPSASRGKHGYWKSTAKYKGGSTMYCITSFRWWVLFGGQYGHKYKGKHAVAAADNAAVAGGYIKPQGTPQHYEVEAASAAQQQQLTAHMNVVAASKPTGARAAADKKAGIMYEMGRFWGGVQVCYLVNRRLGLFGRDCGWPGCDRRFWCRSKDSLRDTLKYHTRQEHSKRKSMDEDDEQDGEPKDEKPAKEESEDEAEEDESDEADADIALTSGNDDDDMPPLEPGTDDDGDDDEEDEQPPPPPPPPMPAPAPIPAPPQLHRLPPPAEDITSVKWMWWWVWHRSRAQLKLMICGLSMANGRSASDTNFGGCIYTSSFRFRDELVQLSLMAGYSVMWTVNDVAGNQTSCLGRPVTTNHINWKVNFTTQPWRTSLSAATEVTRRPSPYTGRVWCVTVPTDEQLIMVRRVLERDQQGRTLHASRPVVIGNSEKAYITDDELKAIKDLGEPGLRLMGFKSLDRLKNEHNYRSSYFLYPDDSNVRGSTRSFSALLSGMLELQQYAVCSLIAKRGSLLRFVALLPQAEKVDKDGRLVVAGGMHMVFLPYADDMRDVRLQRREQDSGEEERSDADEQLKDKAKAIMHKMTIREYDPSSIFNPALQRHYAGLQAMALQEALDEDELQDELQPDKDKIGHFKAFYDAFNALAFTAPGDKRRAGAAGRGAAGGGGVKRVKREPAAVTDEEYNEVGWETVKERGGWKKLTVAQLKVYLKRHKLPLSGSKDELIRRIEEHIAD